MAGCVWIQCRSGASGFVRLLRAPRRRVLLRVCSRARGVPPRAFGPRAQPGQQSHTSCQSFYKRPWARGITHNWARLDDHAMWRRDASAHLLRLETRGARGLRGTHKKNNGMLRRQGRQNCLMYTVANLNCKRITCAISPRAVEPPLAQLALSRWGGVVSKARSHHPSLPLPPPSSPSERVPSRCLSSCCWRAIWRRRWPT